MTANLSLNQYNRNLEVEEVKEVVNSVPSYMAPIWSSGFSISTGYTATQPLWVIWSLSASGLYSGSYFFVNGIAVGWGFNTYSDRTGGGCASCYVDTGDVITFTRGSVSVYPIKFSG